MKSQLFVFSVVSHRGVGPYGPEAVALAERVRDNYSVMNKYPFRVTFQATLFRVVIDLPEQERVVRSIISDKLYTLLSVICRLSSDISHLISAFSPQSSALCRLPSGCIVPVSLCASVAEF